MTEGNAMAHTTQSGLEHAAVNADGLITSLRDKMVPAGSWV